MVINSTPEIFYGLTFVIIVHRFSVSENWFYLGSGAGSTHTVLLLGGGDFQGEAKGCCRTLIGEYNAVGPLVVGGLLEPLGSAGGRGRGGVCIPGSLLLAAGRLG